MRLQSLCMLLCLLFSISLNAQDYKPLLDDINEWHLTYCHAGCGTDVYYTDGDTIVNGYNYKILDGYHYISRTFLLREEIENQRVYVHISRPEGDREYLLYDFLLEVGDSIDIKNPITPFPSDAGYFQVDSIIRRPLDDGTPYRHFYLSPTPSNPISTNNAVWIEGVGSLAMLTAPGGDPDINGAGALSCFFKNQELFYSNMDSISSCDPLILGMEDLIAWEELVLLQSPNNKTALLQNADTVASIDIFDISGKKLQTIKNNNQKEVPLDFSSYKPGTYIAVAHSHSFQKQTFKIIIGK